MQPSPYTPGAPSEHLYGRSEQLAAIYERLDLLTSLGRMIPRIRLDYGPRGLGKTSLLRQVERSARDHGAITCWITGGGGRGLLEELSDAFARAVRDADLPTDRDLRSKLERLSMTLTLGVPGVAQLTAAHTAKAPSGDTVPSTAEFKDAVLGLVDAARRGGKAGVVILIDELQEVDATGLRVLGRAWQELQSEAPDRPVGMFTAGLPGTLAFITKSASFLERADVHEMPLLSMDAARLALTISARSQGVEWNSDALDRAALLSGGHPHVLQTIGDRVWVAAGRPDHGSRLLLEHVEAAGPSTTRQLAGLFRARWDRASDKERQVLSAMARLGGDAPVARTAVENASGIFRSDMSTYRARLIDKGLIGSPSRGQLEFTLPGFAAWILNHLDDDSQLPRTPAEMALLSEMRELQRRLTELRAGHQSPSQSVVTGHGSTPGAGPDSAADHQLEPGV